MMGAEPRPAKRVVAIIEIALPSSRSVRERPGKKSASLLLYRLVLSFVEAERQTAKGLVAHVPKGSGIVLAVPIFAWEKVCRLCNRSAPKPVSRMLIVEMVHFVER